MARLVDETLVVAGQAISVVAGAIVVGVSVMAKPERRSATAIIGWLVVVTGVIVVSWGYEMWSSHSGASIGKRLSGIRLVDTSSLRPGLPGRCAVYRSLLVSGTQPLVWLALGIGGKESTQARIVLVSAVALSFTWRILLGVAVLLWSGFDSVHDRLTGSRVVRARSIPAITAAPN